MKTRLVLLFVAAVMTLITVGCGTPLFGNIKQYRDGDWYLGADPHQVARMEQDKLAVDKLKEQPVYTSSINGVTKGYLGLAVNYYGDIVTIKLIGPQRKIFVLKPKEMGTDYLIPGWYRRIIIYRGQTTHESMMEVGPELHHAEGGQYHWIAYAR